MSIYNSVFIIIFSGVLALGTWNPFVPVSSFENADSGFGIAQIVSVFFIMYLFLRKNISSIIMNRWSNVLYTFFTVFSLTTLLCNLNEISLSTIIFLFKFLLVILLCLQLPKLFVENRNYVYISIYVFSIVSSIIAVLFWCGLLEQYITINQGRFSLFGENPNSTSARFSLAFILLLHVILKNPFFWSKKRFFQLVLLMPLINIVLASGSRGSFIILVISTFLYLILFPQKKAINKVLIISFLGVALVGGGIFILSKNSDYSILERLLDTYTTGNDAGRDQLNNYALNIWLDSPIVGEGTICFVNEMRIQFGETRTVHNLYFYILATSGIIGFVSFMYFIYNLLCDSLVVRKQEPISLVILLFMLLMAYKTGGALTYMLMWYVFAIIISLKLMKIYGK